jgi:hypothetical protein
VVSPPHPHKGLDSRVNRFVIALHDVTQKDKRNRGTMLLPILEGCNLNLDAKLFCPCSLLYRKPPARSIPNVVKY